MESIIIELMQAFDIGRGLAIVLTLLCIGAGSTAVIMACLLVRTRMHADHFDVVDGNVKASTKVALHALEASTDAIKTASYNDGYLDGISGRKNKHEKKDGD